MTINGNRKGAAAERELSALLADALGVEVKRNTDPAKKTTGDILCIPGYAVECKRVEVLRRNAWWSQAVKQAAIHGVEPIVFYRRNRQPWRALVTSQGGFADVHWTAAMDAMRDKLARLYGLYSVRAA
ncbi:putative PDDEXK endonuclease [Ramlibacter sp. MAHUQ-53]|uniref:putative PDDEXK endonuclease n=1 Tax=unclassified Ramlibacter TaxID=2617605 RepID=UPI0036323B76